MTLEDEAYAAAQNKQWRNKAVSDTYYPGSVFKMITGSMALEEGIVTEDTTYTCTGEWDFGNGIDPISCWNHSGHGTGDVCGRHLQPCNPYMILVGQKLGRQTFFDYFDAFGFYGAHTGVDLPGEADSLYYDVDGLNLVELATESFGQNSRSRRCR